MSSSDAHFVYGCPLGDEHNDNRPKGEDVEIDIYELYGGSCYYYWWGTLFGSVSNGYGSIPTCDDAVKAEVQAEWDALSPEMQKHLGEPREFVCVNTG